MRLRKGFILAIVAFVALTSFQLGLAAAAPSTAGPGAPAVPQEPAGGPYCVTFSKPSDEVPSAEVAQEIAAVEAITGKPAVVQAVVERTCFKTDRELASYERSRGVTGLPGVDSRDDASISSIGSGSNYIATLYYDYNYGGPKEDYVAQYPCDVQSPIYTNVGEKMNDQTSSASAEPRCTGWRFYLNANLNDGPHFCAYLDPNWSYRNCYYVGDGINDLISSMIVVGS